jgi:DNA polymerase I-like protein with 3'-5' exonuclease and polymerase domains
MTEHDRKMKIEGPWFDVQNAEPLIDENQARYNLDALAEKYLQKKKFETELEQECSRRGLKGKVQKHLWRLPASIVGPYAEEDAVLPLEIFKKQKRILDADGLWDLFMIETNLIQLLIQMRKIGVRINTSKLERVIDEMTKRLRRKERELNKIAGNEVEYWAAASIQKVFDRLGISYPLTQKTKQPSFTKDSLLKCENPIGELILECRSLDKFVGTFLTGSLMDQVINGRIHSLFNQQKSDDYGTVTGRFSSSHPNLQFIPIRDEELGPLCRSMFIPEEDCLWGKTDYSQVEFRIFAHYAMGEGADHFRQQYVDEPLTDFHDWCAKEAFIPRRSAKTINFGILYGMGLEKTAASLKRPMEEAKVFVDQYFKKFPFIRYTLQKASNKAADTGFIKTILGRRRRFVYWEPFDRELSKNITAMKDERIMLAKVRDAIAKAVRENKEPPRPGIRRAGTFKGLSALIQGSAADLLKKAMVDCWKAGVFNVLPPHLTVHDELDVSIPKTKEGTEAFAEKKRLMENAIPFKVPIIADQDIMIDWGTK